MSEQVDRPFDFAPLDRYSFSERALIRFSDLVLYLLIRLIGGSVRFEVQGWDNFEEIAAAGKVPIYAFWHNRIFLGTYFFRKRGIVVMTSQSKDGEYIARFIQRLGYGTIRGSSTRGGSRALVEMIRTMRAGTPMAFALDGPKGPRYEAKAGAVVLAKKTGNPIMPFILEPKKYWTAKSWDKLQIPRPFTPAAVIIGKLIYVESDADEKRIEYKRQELQESLDELVERGRVWRDG